MGVALTHLFHVHILTFLDAVPAAAVGFDPWAHIFLGKKRKEKYVRNKHRVLSRV
jgi:hypothetical protein